MAKSKKKSKKKMSAAMRKMNKSLKKSGKKLKDKRKRKPPLPPPDVEEITKALSKVAPKPKGDNKEKKKPKRVPKKRPKKRERLKAPDTSKDTGWGDAEIEKSKRPQHAEDHRAFEEKRAAWLEAKKNAPFFTRLGYYDDKDNGSYGKYIHKMQTMRVAISDQTWEIIEMIKNKYGPLPWQGMNFDNYSDQSQIPHEITHKVEEYIEQLPEKEKRAFEMIYFNQFKKRFVNTQLIEISNRNKKNTALNQFYFSNFEEDSFLKTECRTFDDFYQKLK